ncbi:MAG: Hsp20/alpha crystallin family protein [Acidobacteriota bacterium]
MDLIHQIKSGATQLFETLSEGWKKMMARSGQALTRFTHRRGDDPAGSLPDEAESWGVLAGELAETDTHLILRLEAPGMEKEDFDISVEHGVLFIRGEKRFERQEQGASYHVFEAAYGAFERSLALPREVDPERAEATYRRGILTVNLPKTSPRRHRTIQVG